MKYSGVSCPTLDAARTDFPATYLYSSSFLWSCFLFTNNYNLLCQRAWLPSKPWQIRVFSQPSYLVPFSLLCSCLPSETQFFLSKLQTKSVCPSFPLLPLCLLTMPALTEFDPRVVSNIFASSCVSSPLLVFFISWQQTVSAGFCVLIFQGIPFPGLLSDGLLSSSAVPELGR